VLILRTAVCIITAVRLRQTTLNQEGVQVKYDITDEDTVTDPPRQEPKDFYENQTKINRTHLSVQNLEMTMWTDNNKQTKQLIQRSFNT
jgi:hypothetical protein